MCFCFVKNCRFLLTSAFLPPNVFIYRNADLLYIWFVKKNHVNKCLYISAYVQNPISKKSNLLVNARLHIKNELIMHIDFR